MLRMVWGILGLAAISAWSDAPAGPPSLACDFVFADDFDDPAAGSGPVAEAGPNSDILPGGSLTLDGGGSNGQQNYCWTLASRPPGSRGQIVNAETATPTVLTDLAGDYQVNLVVDNGVDTSDPDSALISTRTVSQTVSSAGGVVVSPDRLVTLEIPPNALTQDTDITIRLLTSEELDADLAANNPLASYEFGPDGTQFAVPVHFTAELDPLIPGAPTTMQPATIVSMDGTQAEILDNVVNRMDENRMMVSGELNHFSTLSVIPFSFVSIIPEPVVFGLEGGPIGGDYSVRVIGNSIDPITVSTDVTQPPLESATGAPTPLLGGLTHDMPVDLSFPGQSLSNGSFAGQCLRAGVGEVSLDLLVDGADLVTLPNLLRKGVLPVKVILAVRCFSPQILVLPIARDDAVTPPLALTPTTVAVLANDTTTGIDLTTLRIERSANSGSLRVNADGTITYTPNRLVIFDRFDYSFRNTGGLKSNIATVFLSPLATPNQPPTATTDNAITLQDQAISISILANDTDADGSLDPATVSLDLQGTLGQVAINPDGSTTYTPPTGFIGIDAFGYRVKDDDGADSNATSVGITVNTTGAPPATTQDNFTLIQDIPDDLFVLANDDGNINVMSLTIEQLPNFGNAEVMLTQTGGTTKGTPSGPGSIDAFIRYSPDSGYVGNDLLTYSVTDPDGNGSSQAQVFIIVAPPNNQPPIAVDDSAATLPNQPVTIVVGINDFDSDSLIDVGSVRVVTPPANGTASSGGGAVVYTPNPGFVGVDTFTYDIADAFGARSNAATVSITVAPPQNENPVAQDDSFTMSVDSDPISFGLVGNDSDPDGNVDPVSVVITHFPTMGGTLNLNADGSVEVTPDPGFMGTFSFRYTVADELAAVSNEATVTIDVRAFLGADNDPTDNVSAAQVTFVSFFGNAFMDLGDGSAAGVSHNDNYPDNLIPIADYTHLFRVINTDQGVDETFNFSTDQQDFSATFNGSALFPRYAFSDLNPGPTFDDTPMSTLTLSGDNLGMMTVNAPSPLRDSMGQVINLFSDFDGFGTLITIPPNSGATHLLVRVIGSVDDPTVIGVILRIPLIEIPVNVNGDFQRPLMDATARATLQSLGFRANGQVLIILYNEIESDDFFDFPGARDVPFAAGRGYSLPPEQLNPRPDLCANIRKNTLCQGGPNLRILATNRNGNLELFDPKNGNYLGNLIGGNVPNFTVRGSSNKTIQDRNNCLLMIDSGNIESAFVHRFDTDGTVVTDSFIEIPRPNGVGTQPVTQIVGIDQRNDNIVVTVNGTGEIREYNPDTGVLIGIIADDLIRPDAVYVDVDGDLFVTDQGFSGTEDQLLVYPADGSPRRVLIDGASDTIGLGTPYQIARLQNGNLGLANFGGNAIRVFQDGFPLIVNLVIGNNLSGDPYLPRGIWPLNEGTFLISANNGGGVSKFDPFDVAGGGVQNLVSGSSYAKFGTACMP